MRFKDYGVLTIADMNKAVKSGVIFICLVTNSVLMSVWSSSAEVSQVQEPGDLVKAQTKNTLKGKVEEVDASEGTGDAAHKEAILSPGRAQEGAKEGGYLKGSAQIGELDSAKEDPDADDKELMIAWDRWRNRFLQAVLGSTTEMLNSDQTHSFQINPYTHTMESVYPVGTEAWFVCEVTKDRQIKRLRILTSSGYPEYDQAVLEAVQDLQGSSILRFPSGSRRNAVLQGGAVERASQPQQQYFRFGDTEHIRVPAN